MTLNYSFICEKCGELEIGTEDLEISLTAEHDLFVHDVGWEELPKGWTFDDGAALLCKQCSVVQAGGW